MVAVEIRPPRARIKIGALACYEERTESQLVSDSDNFFVIPKEINATDSGATGMVFNMNIIK